MAMNPTINYFPPKRQDQELYKFFSTAMDAGIEEFFTQNFSINKDMFNPASKYFDADYLINILGGTNFLGLLKTPSNKTSIALLLPGLVNLKGTMEGLQAILKLTKINYKNIVFIKQRNGCTQATIVVSEDTTVDETTIKLLDEFVKELMPTCAQISGITNCLQAKGSYNESDFDLGINTLSSSFKLDSSYLGRSQGYQPPGTDINMLFCRTSFGQIVEASDITVVIGNRTVTSISEISGLSSIWLLDRTLILSRQSKFDFLGVDCISGKVTDGYADFSDISNSIQSRSISYCYNVVVPGYTLLSRDYFGLSDNGISRQYDNTLDDGKLSTSIFLSRGTVITRKVSSININDVFSQVKSFNFDQFLVKSLATITKSGYVRCDGQYSDQFYNSSYDTDGPELLTSSSNTVLAVSNPVSRIFDSVSISDFQIVSAAENTAEYQLEVSNSGVSENALTVGLYTVLDYDKNFYEV